MLACKGNRYYETPCTIIGGGLVIYVIDIYHCTRRTDLESISLECMVRNQTTVFKTTFIIPLLQATIL